jgi:hypothetical protein
MMTELKNWFNKCVLDSPGCKTVFGFVLPIITGILSGTFVSEITTINGLDWKLAKSSKSAYGLIILVYFIYKYHRTIYMREKEVARFLDNDYCVAYMRSQCLPEAAEKYKRIIKDGQGGELKQAMDELRKVLK